MTDLPYTDEDLRAEAAGQHAALSQDPDFMGVGEQMEESLIPSCMGEATGPSWADALDDKQFDEAQRKIHRLISGAADVSEWAVNLGADGLEPDGHTLQLGTMDGLEVDEPTVRLHFAFHPDMKPYDRDRFVMELSKVVMRNL